MKIDYEVGDRIICIFKFMPLQAWEGQEPPFLPAVGEIYTCVAIEECDVCPTKHLVTELAEIPDWEWHAECFRKVPELPPREREVTRKKGKELEDA